MSQVRKKAPHPKSASPKGDAAPIKKPRHVPAPVLPQLYPHQIIRYRDAAPYFGYKHAQFDALVRSGGLPKPFPLSETGKASGYTGQMILDHLEKMQKRAKAQYGFRSGCCASDYRCSAP